MEVRIKILFTSLCHTNVYFWEAKVVESGLGANLNFVKPIKGSSVAVFSLGAVGLAVTEGARIAGVSRTIRVDLRANRLQEVCANM
ncbi:Alcohol dehydrogenase 2 [Helianthus annuus]|nr:Alcohol dehydrogenase 2 [Helianthus annuus]